MYSVLAFLIVLLHWGIIAAAHFLKIKEVFNLVFVFPSPIQLFFTLLQSLGTKYDGSTVPVLAALVAFDVLKYFILIASMVREGRNFYNVSAILGEAGYLLASSLYLVYYDYL